MQFHLVYRGPLKSNGKSSDKHHVRRAIHSQLRQLVEHPPLNGAIDLRDDWMESLGILQSPGLTKEQGQYRFCALFPKSLNVVVELDILMLRPETPGAIVVGGDIDNRLKTLFDALRLPQQPEELPRTPPGENESPFCCLLEDDVQIVKVQVQADRLLEPVSSQTEVQLFLKVVTRLTKVTYGNLGLA